MTALTWESPFSMNPVDRMALDCKSPLALSRRARRKCHALNKPLNAIWAKALERNLEQLCGKHIEQACDLMKQAILEATRVAAGKPETDHAAWLVAKEAMHLALQAEGALITARDILRNTTAPDIVLKAAIDGPVTRTDQTS